METSVYVKWQDGKVEKYPLHLARVGDTKKNQKIIGYIKYRKNNEIHRYVLEGFDPKDYAFNSAQIYKIGGKISEL